MEEESKTPQTIVGRCEKIGGYYQLPISQDTVIERCEQDPKFFAVKGQESQPCENKAKVIVGLSKFFNTDERVQLFIATAPEDNTKKALLIRVNGDNAVVVFPDMTVMHGQKMGETKYNSFVFHEELVYLTLEPYVIETGEMPMRGLFDNPDGELGKILKVKKEDQYFGTLKEFFNTYSSLFDVAMGDLILEMI